MSRRTKKSRKNSAPRAPERKVATGDRSRDFVVGDHRNGGRAISASVDTGASFSTSLRWGAARVERINQAIDTYDREKLSSYARYEYFFNQRCAGLVHAITLGLVGIGPRPQVRTKNPDFNHDFEAILTKHYRRARIADVARQSTAAMVIDGESFIQFAINPRGNTYSKIQPVVIDCRRIRQPVGVKETSLLSGGIQYDEYGNELAYCILDRPYLHNSYYDVTQYQWMPSEYISHMYEPRLPEQLRGFSWFAPGLEALGRIRDFDEAASEAAKMAAHVTGVAITSAGWDGGEEDAKAVYGEDYHPFGSTTAGQGTWIFAPPGVTDVKGFQATQPIASHIDFVNSGIASVGHGMGVPEVKSIGTAKNYNFSSAKTDLNNFEALGEIIHENLESYLYEKDARLVYMQNSAKLIQKHGEIPDFDDIQLLWYWKPHMSLDQQKEASADEIRLRSGTITRKEIIERDGGDYESFIDTWKREQSDFGVIPSGGQPNAFGDGENPDETIDTEGQNSDG